MSDKSDEVVIEKSTGANSYLLNLLEVKQPGKVTNNLEAYEIRTIGFDR